MNTKVRRVKKEESDLLSSLLNEYQKELSSIAPYPLPTHYPYLDVCFTDKNRDPYFIYYGNTIAGVIIVNQKDFLTKGEFQTITDFYIVPSYRKKGIGTQAVKIILNRYPGQWILRVFTNNPAKYFWINTLKKLTENSIFEEISDKIVIKFKS